MDSNIIDAIIYIYFYLGIYSKLNLLCLHNLHFFFFILSTSTIKFIFKNICKINQVELDPYNYCFNYTKYLMINQSMNSYIVLEIDNAYKNLGT